MPFRFLHSADWQLGKGFGGFAPEAAVRLRDARRAAVRRIAALAREQGAEAVLVAGDVFDSVAVSDATLEALLHDVSGFPGPWLLLPGNHDPALAESPWTRLRRRGLPPNVVPLDRPEPLALGPAVILPAPLLRLREAADPTLWFDGAASPPGAFRIGLAHGGIGGTLPVAAEAANRIDPERALSAGLDFLALGDWHGTREAAPRSWYSGTPEPDRFRANDAGNVLLVSLEAPGAPARVERRRTGRIDWIAAELPVLPGSATEIRAALAGLTATADRVLRLAVTGRADLATRAALGREIAAAAVRVIDLEADLSGLALEPSADDLDAIDTGGFVRRALEDLRARLDGPEAATARRALEILHAIHAETGR